MKKILCAMLLSVGFVSQANAFDFLINDDVMKQVILQAVIAEVVGTSNGTLNMPGATIHTGVASATGKASQCWTKVVYHADGSRTPKVVCQ